MIIYITKHKEHKISIDMTKGSAELIQQSLRWILHLAHEHLIENLVAETNATDRFEPAATMEKTLRECVENLAHEPKEELEDLEVPAEPTPPRRTVPVDYVIDILQQRELALWNSAHHHPIDMDRRALCQYAASLFREAQLLIEGQIEGKDNA